MTRSTDAETGFKDRLAGYYDKWYRYNRPDNGAEYDKGVVRAVNSGRSPIDRFTMIESFAGPSREEVLAQEKERILARLAEIEEELQKIGL